MREDTTGCIQTRDPRDHGQITSRMGNLMPLSTFKEGFRNQAVPEALHDGG